MYPTAARALVLVGLAVIATPVAADEPNVRVVQPARLSAPARGAAATVDAFHAALGRGDTRSAVALLADDALIFEGGGVERTKQEYASHHLAADAAFSQAVPS